MSRWEIGGRYGNAWTELVLGDYEARVLVQTHEDGRTRYPQEPDYREREGCWAWLEAVRDALNAAGLSPSTANDPTEQTTLFAGPSNTRSDGR